jgi:uncharacterized membrane protein YfcA
MPVLAANATIDFRSCSVSLMALRRFQSQRKMDWSAAWKIVLPATLGSAAGV